MKRINRSIRIIILGFFVGGFLLTGGLKDLLNPDTVKAFGDLVVNFHVPNGTPIFSASNLKPGDVLIRPIDVVNNGSVPRFIRVKGVKTSGSSGSPKIESILDVIVKDGSNIVYGIGSSTGVKSLKNFLDDSNTSNGIKLSTINPSQGKTYNFQVSFPLNAGNEYQGKFVKTDLIFGEIKAHRPVINEVYCEVDDRHGRQDRDRNDDEFDRSHRGKLYDSERHTNQISKRQWIEVYNPTDDDVSLKNWMIQDNDGSVILTRSDIKVRSGEFVLISKDDSVWRYWNQVNRNVFKIYTNKSIGNGFDCDHDRIALKDDTGREVDHVDWRNTTHRMIEGYSLSREVPGFDTESASDWVSNHSPDPGK